VLNAAHLVVRDTRKFDHRLTTLLLDELHWLNVYVSERVTYKLGVVMYGTDVCMARHLGTSPTISPQRLTSLLGSVCVPQTDTSLSSLAVDSTSMAVGLFRFLVRRSGTRYPMTVDNRHVLLAVLNSFLRQSCLVKGGFFRGLIR